MAKKIKTANPNPLPELPKLPKLPRKPRAKVPCACGCGMDTTRTFAPGHDARVNAWALRVERGVCKLDDVLPEETRELVREKLAKAA